LCLAGKLRAGDRLRNLGYARRVVASDRWICCGGGGRIGDSGALIGEDRTALTIVRALAIGFCISTEPEVLGGRLVCIDDDIVSLT
jgi:hypothetical protein